MSFRTLYYAMMIAFSPTLAPTTQASTAANPTQKTEYESDPQGTAMKDGKSMNVASEDVFVSKGEIGVISDIDSTVKKAGASEAYPGVLELYQALDRGPSGDGASGDVTFVTARIPILAKRSARFLTARGFEDPVIETGKLKSFLSAAVGGRANIEEKIADASKRFDAFPEQFFVLFGDNSQSDPEVYRELLEKYPNRIRAAFIHVVKECNEAERFEGLIPIQNYAEAAKHLEEMALISSQDSQNIQSIVHSASST